MNKSIDYFKNSLVAENKSAKTIKAYLYNLELFKRHVGGVKLSALGSQHVRSFLAARAAYTSPHTLHQAFRVLRTFFNWCVREGFIKSSPMSNIKAPKLDTKVIATYTREDIQTMLAVCPAKRFLGARNRAIISILLDTGIRESELTGLCLNDIDYQIGVMKVRGKGNKERITHISNKARQALWHYLMLRDIKAPPEAESLFLSEEMRPLTADGLSCIVRKIGKIAGVKKVNVHKFRHTCAIEFLRNGGDITILRHMLGHTNIATTMRYLTALNSDDVISKHRQFSPGDRML